MRHPLHRTFRLPATFVSLVEFIMDGLDPNDPDVWRYAEWIDRGGDLFCGDLDPSLLGEPPSGDDPRALCGELTYHFQPLEILPFCWNGGDALHYGWAVLAPELDAEDHLCVSFAPVDDRALWLGDNTKEALENLLVGSVANWSARGGPEKRREPPAEDARWAPVCRALGLRPDLGSTQIAAGARSKRAIRPVVPQGWRYEPTGDGIGVLADAAAFAPGTVRVDHPWDSEAYEPSARRFLADGYPGSALCVLKSLSSYDRTTVILMREAYRQLGRELHAERAELWLRLHPSD
ncbi:hypothetical protein ABGB18_31465 [Nonomuraea sp. B12E4]|uniref:hypothetical protein n=1 Tax=Nonomuraea sp. B12E4 TaxID=3153564 RepID=UPI00325E93D0